MEPIELGEEGSKELERIRGEVLLGGGAPLLAFRIFRLEGMLTKEHEEKDHPCGPDVNLFNENTRRFIRQGRKWIRP